MTYYDIVGFAEEDAGSPVPPTLDDVAGCCLFLDFDGTLVDIAETPDAIRIAPDLGALLDRVSERLDGRVAVVSGRTLDELQAYLPDFSGPLIGSHGAERADGRHPAADSEELTAMRGVAEAFADAEEGVIFEEKPASFVLHFRQVPHRMADGERLLEAVVRQHEGWHVHHAKMALEVMHEDVSKGAAIGALIGDWAPAKPVAIGDDLTDEAMFRVVQHAGGTGIKVGSGRTCAERGLPGVAEVHAFLAALTGEATP